ncbi:hypothetical protein HPB49_014233 [Dermacentor silvarum]|uniref:Uncharacterized protein n=1 Tax=Dermacentor silvarum TaxID=543639 RepID=A0ACB8CXS2_DERSI|nr:hypothetical protein HPB49_014233 [Dermacentor silvarum]
MRACFSCFLKTKERCVYGNNGTRSPCQTRLFEGTFAFRKQRRRDSASSYPTTWRARQWSSPLKISGSPAVGSEATVSLSQPSVSRCVHAVSEAIVRVGTEQRWLSFPRTRSERALVKQGFLRSGNISDVVVNVVGCVDDTYIAITAPELPPAQKQTYWCRNGYYALNTMVVCDSNMRVLAIDPRFAGSCHDAYVWRGSALRSSFADGCFVNKGEFLLGEYKNAYKSTYEPHPIATINGEQFVRYFYSASRQRILTRALAHHAGFGASRAIVSGGPFQPGPRVDEVRGGALHRSYEEPFPLLAALSCVAVLPCCSRKYCRGLCSAAQPMSRR